MRFTTTPTNAALVAVKAAIIDSVVTLLGSSTISVVVKLTGDGASVGIGVGDTDVGNRVGGPNVGVRVDKMVGIGVFGVVVGQALGFMLGNTVGG